MLLVLVLMASSSIAVLAEEPTGSITINGVTTEGTYEIYRLLDLESYDVGCVPATTISKSDLSACW